MFDEDNEFCSMVYGSTMTLEEEKIQDEIDNELEKIEKKYNILINYTWRYHEK